MNRDDVMNIFSNIIKTYNENNIGLKGMNLGFFSLYLNKLLKETDNGIIVVLLQNMKLINYIKTLVIQKMFFYMKQMMF